MLLLPENEKGIRHLIYLCWRSLFSVVPRFGRASIGTEIITGEIGRGILGPGTHDEEFALVL